MNGKNDIHHHKLGWHVTYGVFFVCFICYTHRKDSSKVALFRRVKIYARRGGVWMKKSFKITLCILLLCLIILVGDDETRAYVKGKLKK